MKKLLTTTFALALLTVVGILPAAAQADELHYDHRVQGDRSLTIQLGPMIPTANQTFTGSFRPSNLSVGGTMGIDLDFYLNEGFRLGGGLRGMAVSGVNADTLFIVPITFRATYELKVYPFSFPIGAGVGFSFTNHKTETSFDPTLIPTIGAFYNLNSSWSFGATYSEWIIFQPFFSSGALDQDQSRIGYFTDLTVGAIYHF